MPQERDLCLKYAPHPKQRIFHLATQPIKVAVCGARSGKTICAAAEFVDKCIGQPGYRELDRQTRNPYVVVAAAPTYRMMDRVVVPAVMRAIPDDLILHPYHQTRQLLIIRGQFGQTHIYFMNASNPEAWQGQELYGVWIDEFALCKESMFDEARARLATCKGWMILTGTLRRGPGWAQKRIREYSQTPTGMDQIALVQWNTLDNPYAPKEQIEEIRRSSPPKYFARMYEATWEVFEGQVYEELTRATHIVNAKSFQWILPNGRVVGHGPKRTILSRTVAGVDWGHVHPGVIVVAGKAMDGMWYILEESYASGLLVNGHSPVQDSWVRRARELKAKWGITTMWCDPEGAANCAIFRDHKLPACGAHNDVYDGIMSVSNLLHPDDRTGMPKMQILDCCERTITEMLGYQWTEDKNEGFKEVPLKRNDHACDAVRYLLHSEIVAGSFVDEPLYRKAQGLRVR